VFWVYGSGLVIIGIVLIVAVIWNINKQRNKS
jgi:hypothetical protein